MDSALDDANANARTLYIGNLDPSVSEELLMALFTQIGPCKNCKIIHESTIDPYAFIEFTEHQAAARALLAMNKRLVMGREIKVNWAATSTSATNKTDTSKHYHIFVGDIALDIDQNILYEAFSPFGEISEIKIAKFPDTQRSKGYCFIAFTNQNDAETAIASMNGQWLGTRKIRTNWATRKAATNETGNSTQNRESNRL
jgi:nucleolysin TIA-1/TIAR